MSATNDRNPDSSISQSDSQQPKMCICGNYPIAPGYRVCESCVEAREMAPHLFEGQPPDKLPDKEPFVNYITGGTWGNQGRLTFNIQCEDGAHSVTVALPPTLAQAMLETWWAWEADELARIDAAWAAGERFGLDAPAATGGDA